jgi:hypothetical protein
VEWLQNGPTCLGVQARFMNFATSASSKSDRQEERVQSVATVATRGVNAGGAATQPSRLRSTMASEGGASRSEEEDGLDQLDGGSEAASSSARSSDGNAEPLYRPLYAMTPAKSAVTTGTAAAAPATTAPHHTAASAHRSSHRGSGEAGRAPIGRSDDTRFVRSRGGSRNSRVGGEHHGPASTESTAATGAGAVLPMLPVDGWIAEAARVADELRALSVEPQPAVTRPTDDFERRPGRQKLQAIERQMAGSVGRTH